MNHLGAVYRPAPSIVKPLAERASLTAMSIPLRADWFAKCPADGNMYGNDICGDCVPVADYRLIEVRRANAWNDTWQIPKSAPMMRYSALTGYDPLTGLPDEGTETNLDMGNWCSKGIRIDSQNLDVPFWTTVNPNSDDHLAIAIAHTGPILVTLALPLSAQDDATWAQPPTGNPKDNVGSWGEHRVLVGAFDGTTRVCRTWGRDLIMHPEWWAAYVLSVDAMLSREWFDATGLTPSGLDWAALENDMIKLYE